VCERHIDEREPAGGKKQIGREPHPVRHRACHQRHRDDRKRHLVQHEKRFRYRLRRRVNTLHRHSDQEPAIERADPGTVADEGQRIAERHPENRDDRDGREALRHRRQHVLLAHHAGIEQRQAGYRHHQYQRGGDDHPRGIGGIDGGRLGGQGRRRERARRKSDERSIPRCTIRWCPHGIPPAVIVSLSFLGFSRSASLPPRLEFGDVSERVAIRLAGADS
jgi:hypothetical protein